MVGHVRVCCRYQGCTVFCSAENVVAWTMLPTGCALRIKTPGRRATEAAGPDEARDGDDTKGMVHACVGWAAGVRAGCFKSGRERVHASLGTRPRGRDMHVLQVCQALDEAQTRCQRHAQCQLQPTPPEATAEGTRPAVCERERLEGIQRRSKLRANPRQLSLLASAE